MNLSKLNEELNKIISFNIQERLESVNNIQYLYNPTKSELQGLINKSNDEIRGILMTDTNELYIWNAYNYTHSYIDSKLGLRGPRIEFRIKNNYIFGNGPDGLLCKEYIELLNKSRVQNLGLKIFNPLSEKFEEIEQNVWATNSGYDVINRMKHKPTQYRMIWDGNIKYYFIGDAFDYIHDDILEHAYYNGFYPDMLSANDCNNYMTKNMETHTMILFAFEPYGSSLTDAEKSSDGYTRKYLYDFGSIYSHEFTPFEKCPLYDLLGEPKKKEFIYN